MKISDFKLLTDENIDAELVVFLKDQGFDVFDIQEQKLFQLSDKAILEMSVKQNRVIVSQDSDFGTLIYKEALDFVGIIFLLPGHYDPKFHIQTWKSLLQSNLNFESRFILVAENKNSIVRFRLRQME